MKFEDGNNIIRVISTGVVGLQHSMKTANRFINLGPCPEDASCEHCKNGYEPRRVWKWIIFDYADRIVKILDAGPMIGNQICSLASQEQKDPQDFNIVINKRGTGFKTEYKCDIASKDLKIEEISEKEKEAFGFKKKRLVNKYFMNRNKEVVDQIDQSKITDKDMEKIDKGK